MAFHEVSEDEDGPVHFQLGEEGNLRGVNVPRSSGEDVPRNGRLPLPKGCAAVYEEGRLVGFHVPEGVEFRVSSIGAYERGTKEFLERLVEAMMRDRERAS